MQAQITHLQQRSSSAAAEVVSCEQQRALANKP
jgi:hypothetical protein